MSTPRPPRARACDACHSIKIKCELGSTGGPPPCQRCVRLGKDCTITPPKKQKDRVAELEAKVQALTRLLEAQGLSPDSISQDASILGNDDAAIPSYTYTSTSTSNAAPATSKKRRLEDYVSPPSAIAIGGTSTFELDRVVPPETQSRILKRYVDYVYPNFPILPLPTDHRLEIMRSTRPKVLQAIVYAGASGFLTLDDQEKVAQLLMADGAENAALTIGLGGGSTLELLQALLIVCYWWWAPKNYKPVAIHQLIEATADIAREVGVANDPTIPQAGLAGAKVGERLYRNYEASATWRAWLTGYMLNAMWSTYTRKPLQEQWTARHDDCLMMLDYSPHSVKHDKLLAQYVRGEKLCARVVSEMDLDKPDAHLEISSAEAQVKIHMLQNVVLDWQAQTPAPLRQKPLLLFWQHLTMLLIHEPVLHTASSKSTFSAPFLTERISVSDFPAPLALPEHANSLYALTRAAHALIDAYCAIDINIIMALPGMAFAPRVLYAMYLLTKVYIACAGVGNTYGSVMDAEALQLDAYFAKIADVAAMCKAVDEKASAAGLLASAARMQDFYHNFKATFTSSESSCMQPSGLASSMTAIHPMEYPMDLEGLAWDDDLLMPGGFAGAGTDFGISDLFANAMQPMCEHGSGGAFG